MQVQLSPLSRRLAPAIVGVAAGIASAQPVDITVWNRSAAPTAPYGPCYDGPTAQSTKLRLPAYLGETAEEMVAASRRFPAIPTRHPACPMPGAHVRPMTAWATT
jgi:hypothetical protein